MPVAPEHAGGGPVYFAWVDADETSFGPEHVRYDDYITKLNIHLEEGSLPTATLTMKNPGALLASGRKRWCWIAFLVNGEVVPKFFGSVVAIPSKINARLVEVRFIAKPLDYLARKQAAAEPLKVPPYYDRAFIDDAHADDPDTILEALPADWHHDPVTHGVTVSDKLAGEDGVKVFAADKVIYGSLDWSIGDPPPRAVNMAATVTWTQVAGGVIALPRMSFSGPIAGKVLSDWPKPGAQLGGGWSVETASSLDRNGVEGAQTKTFTYSWQNREKTHINGDTMSLNDSLTTIASGSYPFVPDLARTPLIDFNFTVQRTIGDPESGTAASTSQQWSGSYVLQYAGVADLSLRYDAKR
jgi:hypothetical protein